MIRTATVLFGASMAVLTPSPRAQAAVPPAEAEGTSPDAETATAAAIAVHERRLDPPITEDANAELSGRRARELGMANLAQALDLLPSVEVRSAGRGGEHGDIRGARKGAVMMLVDGVPVADPFNGIFDVTSIPTTDLAELRVSTSPVSPLEGPGGSGGVIELISRSAVGAPRAEALAGASSAAGGSGAFTARDTIGPGIAVRASASGTLGARLFPVEGAAAVGLPEDARTGAAALLAERVLESGRIGLDVWASRRSYLVAPAELPNAVLTTVDREDSLRASILGNARIGAFELGARAFGQAIALDSRSTLVAASPSAGAGTREDLVEHRAGGTALLSGPLAEELLLRAAATFDEDDAEDRDERGRASRGSIRIFEPAGGVVWTPGLGLSVDASAGLAAPLGSAAGAWPEAKLVLDWSDAQDRGLLQARLTAARKGRLPTLRERFALDSGNPAIAPEIATYGEAKLILTPHRTLSLSADGFARTVEGLIRFAPGATHYSNAGDAAIAGGDLRLDLSLAEEVALGAQYTWERASSAVLGPTPLDFFPEHRLEAWASGRIGPLGAWARARYQSSELDSGTTLPATVRIDAALWWTAESTRVTLRAENLLGRRDPVRAGVPGDGLVVTLALAAVL
jgi:outer membrane receptor protein involved in Fe transport